MIRAAVILLLVAFLAACGPQPPILQEVRPAPPEAPATRALAAPEPPAR